MAAIDDLKAADAVLAQKVIDLGTAVSDEIEAINAALANLPTDAAIQPVVDDIKASTDKIQAAVDALNAERP